MKLLNQLYTGCIGSLTTQQGRLLLRLAGAIIRIYNKQRKDGTLKPRMEVIDTSKKILEEYAEGATTMTVLALTISYYPQRSCRFLRSMALKVIWRWLAARMDEQELRIFREALSECLYLLQKYHALELAHYTRLNDEEFEKNVKELMKIRSFLSATQSLVHDGSQVSYGEVSLEKTAQFFDDGYPTKEGFNLGIQLLKKFYGCMQITSQEYDILFWFVNAMRRETGYTIEIITGKTVTVTGENNADC